MYLLHLEQIGITGSPISGNITLGQNPVFQEFIPYSLNTRNLNALSDLSGNFLSIELWTIKGVDGPHVDPLTAVALN
jgi:hypothetical protein